MLKNVMALIFKCADAIITRKGYNMGAFSEEFERSLLERVDDIANKKLELEKQLINPLDIITAKQLKENIISKALATADQERLDKLIAKWEVPSELSNGLRRALGLGGIV